MKQTHRAIYKPTNKINLQFSVHDIGQTKVHRQKIVNQCQNFIIMNSLSFSFANGLLHFNRYLFAVFHLSSFFLLTEAGPGDYLLVGW